MCRGKLELNSAGHRPSRIEFGQPFFRPYNQTQLLENNGIQAKHYWLVCHFQPILTDVTSPKTWLKFLQNLYVSQADNCICLYHWSQTQFLEGHSSAQFSSNPNQTHLIQLIKVLRITRNVQAGVIWSWLELNCAELQEISLRPLVYIIIQTERHKRWCQSEPEDRQWPINNCGCVNFIWLTYSVVQHTRNHWLTETPFNVQ